MTELTEAENTELLRIAMNLHPARRNCIPLETANVVTLVGGQRIYAHAQEVCADQPCTIHNPTPHHMVTWDQNWRSDRSIMERICKHGVGHPDPDDLTTDTMHGCDGCCTPPKV